MFDKIDFVITWNCQRVQRVASRLLLEVLLLRMLRVLLVVRGGLLLYRHGEDQTLNHLKIKKNCNEIEAFFILNVLYI